MIKLMALLKRKKGMSRADFKAYYDNVHSPKNIVILAGKAVAFHRNYVVQSFDEWGEGFDVITEIFFNNMEDVHKALEAFGAANNSIEQDDLFDRSVHQYVIVETTETDPSLLRNVGALP